MTKLNLAVLFGGHSLEHDISIRSFKNVVSALDTEKYTILPIYISKTGGWFLYDGNLTHLPDDLEKFGTRVTLSTDKNHPGLLRIVNDKIKTLRVDCAFPVIHGGGGEDGTLQGLFEIAGIPYVGCGVLSSSVSMDKTFTKIIAAHYDVPTVPYLVFRKSDALDLDEMAKQIKDELGYPCFIKPASGGSSVGASKAKTKKQVVDGLIEAFKCDEKVLVEKYIKAKEVECAALDTKDGLKISVVGEVSVASSGEFYGYDEKYNNPETANIIPAKINDEIKEKIRAYGRTIFNAVDGKGLARIDFFLENRTNALFFNEINTLPGFTNASMYPLLADAMGYPLPKLLDTLIESALSDGQ